LLLKNANEEQLKGDGAGQPQWEFPTQTSRPARRPASLGLRLVFLICAVVGAAASFGSFTMAKLDESEIANATTRKGQTIQAVFGKKGSFTVLGLVFLGFTGYCVVKCVRAE
jgi:hypothetical protein